MSNSLLAEDMPAERAAPETSPVLLSGTPAGLALQEAVAPPGKTPGELLDEASGLLREVDVELGDHERIALMNLFSNPDRWLNSAAIAERTGRETNDARSTLVRGLMAKLEGSVAQVIQHNGKERGGSRYGFFPQEAVPRLMPAPPTEDLVNEDVVAEEFVEILPEVVDAPSPSLPVFRSRAEEEFAAFVEAEKDFKDLTTPKTADEFRESVHDQNVLLAAEFLFGAPIEVDEQQAVQVIVSRHPRALRQALSQILTNPHIRDQIDESRHELLRKEMLEAAKKTGLLDDRHSAASVIMGMAASMRPEWSAGAACNDMPQGWFYPKRGESAREPKEVCAGCEVARECLRFAIENKEMFGIWGGYSERERRRIRKIYNTFTAGKSVPARQFTRATNNGEVVTGMLVEDFGAETLAELVEGVEVKIR